MQVLIFEAFLMAHDLQLAWQRLTLTDEEEAIVTCEEENSSERAEQVALCLLGKLYTQHKFNVGAMKNVFKNVWKPAQGMIIRDLDWNLFVFQFFSKTDKDFVFNEGPWAFDGCILMLHEMTGLEQPSEVVFSTARFCVKAYDVPALKQTYNFAKFLGSQLGVFVDCVEDAVGGIDKSLNFRVDIDVSKPLRRGIRTIVGGATIWIRLKYVKLPDFCYACGKLGHGFKSCDFFSEGVSEDELQYGSWLRASPLKSRRRNNEADLLEERKLMAAYRQRRESGATRTKLVFGSSSGDGLLDEGRGGVQMLIDGEGVSTPSSDVFKRKLAEFRRVGDSEKVRVVEGSLQGNDRQSQRAEAAVQPRLSQ